MLTGNVTIGNEDILLSWQHFRYMSLPLPNWGATVGDKLLFCVSIIIIINLVCGLYTAFLIAFCQTSPKNYIRN